MTDLSMLRRFPDTCDAHGIHKGEACGKPAVATREDGEGEPMPVCVRHACVGHVVPLRTLLEDCDYCGGAS